MSHHNLNDEVFVTGDRVYRTITSLPHRLRPEQEVILCMGGSPKFHVVTVDEHGVLVSDWPDIVQAVAHYHNCTNVV